MPKRNILIISILCACCLFAVIAGIITERAAETRPEDTVEGTAGVALLTKATYPEAMPGFPNQEDYRNQDTGAFDQERYDQAVMDYQRQTEQLEEERLTLTQAAPDLTSFYINVIPAVFDSSTENNQVFSPASLYFSLGILAELTTGESRQQLFNLLGADSIENLALQAQALWNLNYWRDGLVSSLLANSLWVSEDLNVDQGLMSKIADTYYTSTYSGHMGSDEMNHALQSWLNEQTGGLLAQQSANIQLMEEDTFALISTVYFRGKWLLEYDAGVTSTEIFHGVNEDTETAFMHKSVSNNYYAGEQFEAVCDALGTGSSRYTMWFLLPEEGISPAELLADDAVLRWLSSKEKAMQDRNCTVTMSVPKFDMNSVLETELETGLKGLGVTDIFEDPSPSIDNAALRSLCQSVRLCIDEEGCAATSFTLGVATLIDEAEWKVDFVLDRPFAVAVVNNEGMILFVGAVNQL